MRAFCNCETRYFRNAPTGRLNGPQRRFPAAPAERGAVATSGAILRTGYRVSGGPCMFRGARDDWGGIPKNFSPTYVDKKNGISPWIPRVGNYGAKSCGEMHLLRSYGRTLNDGQSPAPADKMGALIFYALFQRNLREKRPGGQVGRKRTGFQLRGDAIIIKLRKNFPARKKGALIFCAPSQQNLRGKCPGSRGGRGRMRFQL